MNWYVVTIKDENGTYVYENWDQNTSPIQFSLTEGKYDVTVSACNTWECYADGHCSFTVSKNDEPTAPTNVRVSTDKETYQPNADIIVSFSAEGNAQWYEVRAFDENEEMVAIGLDLTSSPFTISIEEPGEYRINVIAYRNETLHNFADCYITVSDTSEPQTPTNVRVSTDKKAYQPGEAITVSVSAENMNWYTLEVLDENGEIVWSNYDYNTTPVSIPPNKLIAGSYTVNAAACNTWENYACANCRITVSKNDEPTAPMNVRVSTDKETYQPNEDIIVSFSAEGDAQWYEVRAFDENEEMVAIGLDLTSSPFTISIEEPGEYRINVIAYRNETLHNFADCYITVSDTSEPQTPTNVRVSTDKKTYQPGETITLSVSADNMNWYVVTIKDENGTYVYENWDQNTSPIQFSLTEGKYDVTVSACNTWECYADGHCSFTVSKNDEPTALTNVRVSTDKETYQPNEDITVSFSAEGDAQWYEVRAFDENEEMVAIGLDLTSSPFTISIEEPGEYRINVIAYRNETLHNFADCYITVSDTSEPQTPTNVRVSTDKKTYQRGEAITVSVSAENMNWYTLEVLDENGDIIWSSYDYNTTPVSIPPNKLIAGSYTVNAAACNTWESYVCANCRISVLSTSELRIPGAAYSFDSSEPSSPRTGDENQISLWVAFLVVSGAAAVAVFPGIRKAKD